MKGVDHVPIYQKRDKTDYSNYSGISFLSPIHKMLSTILLSRVIPYAEEINGDHQRGFRRNSSNNNHVLRIPEVL